MAAKKAKKSAKKRAPRKAAPSVRDALTPKQRLFSAEYLTDLNGTQAAIRAGYSARTANEQAARLLANVSVREEIDRLMAERAKRTEVNADRVLAELSSMAFYDVGAIAMAGINGPAGIAGLPEELRRAIIGWSWDSNGNFVLKLSPKTPQLELIGRHLKMFTDKVEHTGKDGGPISTETTLSPEQIEQIERIRGIRGSLKRK